jgi:pyrroline-5-carboxylate reductase
MKLGIIGCGNMGSALARGIASKKVFPFNNIYVSDKERGTMREINRKFGLRISTNGEIARKCATIIVAVKPQDAKRLLSSIAKELSESSYVISVMAGVRLSAVQAALGRRIAVTRAMPNMAASVGKGITCVSHNTRVKDKRLAGAIFSSVGTVIDVDEKHMDAVTAVSGSGPAYFFYMTEALTNAAMRLGIPREQAGELAVATAIGSGALLEKTKMDPEALRKRVTSKKGTTEAALRVFASNGFKKLIADAVRTAARRSRELSRGV